MTDPHDRHRDSLSFRNMAHKDRGAGQDKFPIGTKVQMAVRYIVAAIATLLSFRFLLALFGTDRTNEFVRFIYTMTEPFVEPFDSLLSSNAVADGTDFEIETLVAILIYILMGVAITSLLDILDKTGHTHRQ